MSKFPREHLAMKRFSQNIFTYLFVLEICQIPLSLVSETALFT